MKWWDKTGWLGFTLSLLPGLQRSRAILIKILYVYCNVCNVMYCHLAVWCIPAPLVTTFCMHSLQLLLPSDCNPANIVHNLLSLLMNGFYWERVGYGPLCKWCEGYSCKGFRCCHLPQTFAVTRKVINILFQRFWYLKCNMQRKKMATQSHKDK